MRLFFTSFCVTALSRDESGSGDWTDSSNLRLGDADCGLSTSIVRKAGRSSQSMSQSLSGDPRVREAREAFISAKKHRKQFLGFKYVYYPGHGGPEYFGSTERQPGTRTQTPRHISQTQIRRAKSLKLGTDVPEIAPATKSSPEAATELLPF
jgi:hypothetical protein